TQMRYNSPPCEARSPVGLTGNIEQAEFILKWISLAAARPTQGRAQSVMSEELKQPSGQEIQIELARIRTLLALDTTLLAWIRTSLTLIAFGFTLASFVRDLIAKGYLRGDDPEYPRNLGISMMALGVAGLLGGALDYVRSVRRVGTGVAMSVWSASLVVTLLVVLISVLLTANLLSHLKPEAPTGRKQIHVGGNR